MDISLINFNPTPTLLKQIFNWRNDPQTRHFSIRQHPLLWDVFCRDFEKKFHSIQEQPPQLILLEGEPVGFLYYESWYKPSVCQLSIFLDPCKKGLKIGSTALKIALQSLSTSLFDEVVAFVRIENKSAQKAFQNAQFEDLGFVELEREGNVFNLLKLRYLKNRPPQGVFVIAEAGSNFHVGTYEEDLQMGKRMILEAYKAGAQAVKFQLYDSSHVYVPNAGSAGYLGQDINEIFNEYALHLDLLHPFASYAKLLGIEFMCSAFSEAYFQKIDPLVSRHKIASYELRHVKLLELAALSQKPLFLSTGSSTEEDIAWALNYFKEAGGHKITLLHCTAQYPAESLGLNLNCISSLQKRFKVPIGYSDHSPHPVHAPTIAVALGAQVIEKHFTMSRLLKGPDHTFAIECNELGEMILAIREAEKMLGLAKKEIFPQEEELALFARRGLQALKPILKGDFFKEGVNVGILRPGNQTLGLHPKYLEKLEGSLALNNIKLGAGIESCDVLWN
ncbi:MAG: hypothetical protein S4CHLAM7_03880 [Chlamydiae bacterium]|nr:hypothetical protein [Chlamydiota bacterium]